jgi:hypothetical protein
MRKRGGEGGIGPTIPPGARPNKTIIMFDIMCKAEIEEQKCHVSKAQSPAAPRAVDDRSKSGPHGDLSGLLNEPNPFHTFQFILTSYIYISQST